MLVFGARVDRFRHWPIPRASPRNARLPIFFFSLSLPPPLKCQVMFCSVLVFCSVSACRKPSCNPTSLLLPSPSPLYLHSAGRETRGGQWKQKPCHWLAGERDESIGCVQCPGVGGRKEWGREQEAREEEEEGSSSQAGFQGKKRANDNTLLGLIYLFDFLASFFSLHGGHHESEESMLLPASFFLCIFCAGTTEPCQCNTSTLPQ